MKILLTVHQFYPNFFSGTEVLTYSVGKELTRLGHRVAVLTGFPASKHLADNERFDEYDLEGMQVFRFHHSHVPMGDQDVVTELEYDNQLTAQYFARIVADFKPDVIHFFHLSRLGGALIDVAVKAGIPAYYTPTDFWSVCPTSQLLLHGGKVCPGPTLHGGNCVKHVAELTRDWKFTRLVPNAVADTLVKWTADGVLPPYPMHREVAAMSHRKDFLVARVNCLSGIISPTQLMTRVLTGNGVDQRLILNSTYGIDTGGYGGEALDVQRGEPLVIGFIGTMATHKGCHVLIEAFKRLPPGAARLKLYGNPSDFPPYYAELQKRAAGVAGIEFLGTFPNTEIGKVIEALHVLVVPSLWYENAPLVVYSSLAAHRPVIASDFPGLSENIKDGVNGLIFPAGDVEALATALGRLIAEPALLNTLSANCRPPKSSAAYVQELLELYEHVGPAPGFGHERANLRAIPPLDLNDKRGSVSGWAVVGLAAPVRVALCRDGKTLGETTRLLPRSDVRDGLKRGGANVKANAFGFVVKLDHGADRNGVDLVCEGAGGRTISVPLRTLASGTSVQTAPGDFIAIDSERLMWQSGVSSSPP